MEREYSRELSLLEQVHVALGSASRLDDFYLILASLLVDSNTFGFSRAFVLPLDERTRVFSGRLALGAFTETEHAFFRSEMAAETSILNAQVEAIQCESPEPAAVQPLYDLRYHSLWIALLQGQDDEESSSRKLNSLFRKIQLRRDALPPGHLLELAASAPHATIVSPGQASLEGLDGFFAPPLIAGRLMTRRGVHGIIIADRKFDAEPLDSRALYHFQWLLNHASISLENVVLVAELTRTTERLRDVDKLKTNFLSIVSHELRTPLTSITGFVQLLAGGQLGTVPDAQRDVLLRVGQHATHLQSMVSDLLELAEVEAGGIINIELEPVDPLQALNAVIPKIESRHGAQKTHIEPKCEGKVPRILADADALERVLFHLLDNAVKFAAKERPNNVSVEFNRTDGELAICIVDTGIGISEEHKREIFDYFYQVDFKLDRSFGGLGIGLTVAKLLLDATGGRIGVESSPETGTRFTLTFPLAPTD